MTFKTGGKGLGYYRDDPTCEVSLANELLPMSGCAPLKLRIEELLSATTKEADDKPPTTSPETVTTRLSRQAPEPNGPLDLYWNDDGSLSAMSNQHRKDGMWAFDTCNANAWPGAKEYLAKTQADFVAVQEARLQDAGCKGVEQTVRNSEWRTAVAPCTVTAADGKSAGLAITGRTHTAMKNSIWPKAWPKLLSDWLILKHVAAICKGELRIGSCYLTSCNVGIKDQRNTDVLQLMVGVFNGVKGPWVVGGDWNCTPE